MFNASARFLLQCSIHAIVNVQQQIFNCQQQVQYLTTTTTTQQQHFIYSLFFTTIF